MSTLHGLADMRIMLDDVCLAYRQAGYEVSTRAFQYHSERVTVTDAAPRRTPAVVQVDEDSLFIWTGLSYFNNDTDHGGMMSQYAGLRLTLRLLSSDAMIIGPDLIPAPAALGSGEAPHLFGYPIILKPGEEVAVAWAQAGEGGANVQIGLLGCKLFTKPYTRDAIYPSH